KRVEPVAVRNYDRGLHGPGGIGRDRLCRRYIEAGTSPRRLTGGPAQILPVVDIQGEDAHPRATAIRLLPDAFVGQFALVARDAVKIITAAVVLDRLDEDRVLHAQRLKHDLAVDELRFRERRDQ